MASLRAPSFTATALPKYCARGLDFHLHHSFSRLKADEFKAKKSVIFLLDDFFTSLHPRKCSFQFPQREKLEFHKKFVRSSGSESSSTPDPAPGSYTTGSTFSGPSGAELWESFENVRKKSPLVHCITNFVSMDILANGLLAAGASPAMIHSTEEVEDFSNISSALYVNIGTLSPAWVEGMKLSVRKMNELDKPWVLDPVGVGATPYRNRVTSELLQLSPAVVRGNASEIIAAYANFAASSSSSTEPLTKGVDSLFSSSQALSSALSLSCLISSQNDKKRKRSKCVVAITGETDYVTDGTILLAVENGTPLLQKITATGCTVTGLIAAFVAASPSKPALATATALAVFGVAAEVAEERCKEIYQKNAGPGSLRQFLLDELHLLNKQTFLERCKVRQLPTA